MERFLNEKTVIIAVAVISILVQSNYFATKLDVSELRNDMLQMKLDLKEYSDKGDKEILSTLENKLQVISNKIDKLR